MGVEEILVMMALKMVIGFLAGWGFADIIARVKPTPTKTDKKLFVVMPTYAVAWVDATFNESAAEARAASLGGPSMANVVSYTEAK